MITLLDGGLGQELVARSGDAPTPLWSTQVMMDHPGLTRGLHADYFAAGASLATTNTYALHHDRLIRAGCDARFGDLYAQALAEAAAARAGHGRGLIAGSMGPLVASYRPETLPPHAEAVARYAEIAAILAPACDVLLAETVASLAHARAVIEGAGDAARAHGRALWLSVTVGDEDGTRLRSGEALADLAALDLPDAVLVNCAPPEAIDAAIPILATLGRPFGAYANGFTRIAPAFLKDSPTVAVLSARQDLGPERYADFVMGWVERGATLVGGCCETTPAHIAEIARRLRAAGHPIREGAP